MPWSDEMADLSAAVDDAFGVSVTYVAVTARGAYNVSTGARAETTATSTITAVRGRSTNTPQGTGRPIESVTYSIAVSEIATPKVGDRLVDSGKTFVVTAVEPDVDRTRTEVTCQRTSG